LHEETNELQTTNILVTLFLKSHRQFQLKQGFKDNINLKTRHQGTADADTNPEEILFLINITNR